MSASIYDWSLVAANNATADADLTWAEGQAPSTVNNSARVMMQRARQFLTDIGGSIAAGGTANAITVTASSPFATYADGQIVAFKATASNTAASTLSVNGIGAKSIRKMNPTGDVALYGGEIVSGGIFTAQYLAALNGAAGGWLLLNPVGATKQIVTVQGSLVTLANSASAQPIFAAANDTLTVPATTTYRFRARLSFNTGAVSHTTAFGFGGTATFTSCIYTSWAISVLAGTLATPQMMRSTFATATVLTAASTAINTDILIEGIIRINGAGTIIPQVTFSVDPTGTCSTAFDSFFELEPIGTNTVAAVGNWS